MGLGLKFGLCHRHIIEESNFLVENLSIAHLSATAPLPPRFHTKPSLTPSLPAPFNLLLKLKLDTELRF